MIYQLHWRDLRPPHDTKFIAQSEDIVDQNGANRLHKRFSDIVEARKSECPHGWGPMICDELAPSFWAGGFRR